VSYPCPGQQQGIGIEPISAAIAGDRHITEIPTDYPSNDSNRSAEIPTDCQHRRYRSQYPSSSRYYLSLPPAARIGIVPFPATGAGDRHITEIPTDYLSNNSNRSAEIPTDCQH